MSEFKSKYTITNTESGFRIDREGGLNLEVAYHDTYIGINMVIVPECGFVTQPVGLYNYFGMMNHISEYFFNRTFKAYARKAVKKEGMDMIGRSLGKRIKPHWERLVKEIATPEVSTLARLMWSSTHQDCVFLHYPELYTEPYKHLRADLTKYHACRLFALAADNSPYFRGTNDSKLHQLSNWRLELSPNPRLSKALNKTLDKMPPGIPLGAILRLSRIDLPRPITNRLHLLLVLEGADHHNWLTHQHTFLNTTPAQIKQAAEVINFTISGKSKARDISNLARTILDYPDPYHGNLPGLARRSHEYHRQLQFHQAQIYPTGKRLDENTPLPLLNLDYEKLETAGVVALQTVGQVIEEGLQMNHCVGGYASVASRGKSFLFHVTHNNHEATIELAPDGRLRQAYGPHNSENEACVWGRWVLEDAVKDAENLALQFKRPPEIPF